MKDTYDMFNGVDDISCEDCGIRSDETKDEILKTNCPYADEIHGRQVPITVCESCYRERSWDI